MQQPLWRCGAAGIKINNELDMNSYELRLNILTVRRARYEPDAAFVLRKNEPQINAPSRASGGRIHVWLRHTCQSSDERRLNASAGMETVAIRISQPKLQREGTRAIFLLIARISFSPNKFKYY